MATKMETPRRRETFDKRSKDELDYWLSKLSRLDEIASLPLDFERPKDDVGAEDSLAVSLTGDSLSRLREITRNSPLLVYTTLVTAMAICLRKYSGADQIVIGSPARLHAGDFDQRPNAVPIIIRFNPVQTVKGLLAEVRQTLINDYNMQGQPIELLIDKLGLQGIENRCPLFNVAVALAGFHGQMPPMKNDLTMTFVQTDDEIAAEFEYHTALLTRQTVMRIGSHFEHILRQMLSDTGAVVGNLEMLTAEEIEHILRAWSSADERQFQEHFAHSA